MGSKRRLVLGMLVLLAYSLAFQGTRGVWEPDEGRYVAVATEMVRGKDWMHPRLHPKRPHWAKPPLAYWALAASMELFGKTTFSVRLPSALAFAATVTLVFWLGWLFVPRSPWLPAVVYASFFLPSQASNIVNTDTLLMLFETAAVGCFAYAYWSAEGAWLRRNGVRLGWSVLGLAFLTKGPPALLPLVVLLVFHLTSSGKRPALKLVGWIGLGLFLLVGGSWFVAVVVENPQLCRYFLWQELALRVFSDYHQRNPEWYGAIVTYAPVLLLGTLPWTFVLGRALFQKTRSWWREWRGRRDCLSAKDQFLLMWFFVPLVVFLLARSRMHLYLLPLFAPAALLVGQGLDPAALRRKSRVIGLTGWFVFLIALRIAGGFLTMDRDARAFAHRLQGVAPGPFREVVFVETTPYMGLTLYLNAEVMRVGFGDIGGGGGNWGSLKSELSAQEQGQLWVVPETLNRCFVEVVQGQGFEAKILGEAKGWKRYLLFIVV